MKNILNSGYLVALGVLSVLIFAQCNDEDNTNHSTIDATNPTVTVIWEAPASMEEADVTYPFTIELSEVQIADVVFVISADGSTATEGEDFDLSTHSIRIPAYSTTGSGSLTVYSDALPEETENIAVQIGDIGLGNVKGYTPTTYNVEITNLVSDDIVVAFDWDGSVDATIGGTLYQGLSLCANVDIDFYISDASGAGIDDDTAATGNCPEVYEFTPGGWTHGDGTFFFVINLWSNGGLAPDDGPIPFPVTINLAQTGVVNISRPQDPSTVIMSDNDGTTYDTVLKVVVAGGGTSYSFYDGITDELIYAN